MDLVDRDRGVGAAALGPLGHPLGVAPLVGEVPDDGGGLRRHLGVEGEGIGLLDPVALVVGADEVLVVRALPDARDEALPDAGGAAGMEAVLAVVPAVEVADDRDLIRIRRPDAEIDALDAVLVVGQVGSQLVVEAVVRSFVEEVGVFLGQQGRGVRQKLLAAFRRHGRHGMSLLGRRGPASVWVPRRSRPPGSRPRIS